MPGTGSKVWSSSSSCLMAEYEVARSKAGQHPGSQGLKGRLASVCACRFNCGTSNLLAFPFAQITWRYAKSGVSTAPGQLCRADRQHVAGSLTLARKGRTVQPRCNSNIPAGNRSYLPCADHPASGSPPTTGARKAPGRHQYGFR